MSAPVALAAGSTAFSTFSQYKAGKAEASLARSNAEQEQRIAEYNAASVEAASKYNVEIAEAAAQRNIGLVDFTTNENIAKRLQESAINHKIMSDNADIFDIVAIDALNRGASAAAAERTKSRQANGTARALLASGGIDVNSGTALNIQKQNRVQGAMNGLIVMNNAEREAYGYRTEARKTRVSASAEAYGAQLDAIAMKQSAEIEKANIRYETDVGKQSTEFMAAQEAANIRASGAAARSIGDYKARVASYTGKLNAASTLISGASSMYDKGMFNTGN